MYLPFSLAGRIAYGKPRKSTLLSVRPLEGDSDNSDVGDQSGVKKRRLEESSEIPRRASGESEESGNAEPSDNTNFQNVRSEKSESYHDHVGANSDGAAADASAEDPNTSDRHVKFRLRPDDPHPDEVEEHWVCGHLPFRSWCWVCNAGKGESLPHFRELMMTIG